MSRVLCRLIAVLGTLIFPTFMAHGQQVVSDRRPELDQHAADTIFDRPITVDVEHVSLDRALQTIAAQSHTTILYDASMIVRYEKPVSVRVKTTPLRTVFAQMFAGTVLKAVAQPHNRLVIVEGASVAPPIDSTGTVVGTVVDSATGKPIPGASVSIHGIRAAITTGQGTFSLRSVPWGDQLVVARSFGHRPMNRTVTVRDSNQTTVRFSLVAVPNVLSDVVTTASGQQRKVEVGNDITTLNVDSVMRVAPIQSVTDLLETRVPGLVIQHTSGAPGDPSRLRLRGAGSITRNNDPIVIVDGIRVYASQSDERNDNLSPVSQGSRGANSSIGVSGYAAPSPLDQIDPNSIQTLEVFKGPSATALYGSDAANGVIVITTKRGQAGPTHWDVAFGAGVNWLPGNWPENYYRFGTETGFGSYGLCSWADRFCQTDTIVPYQALNDSRYSVFSHGTNQTATLTISGGVPTVQYSLSGSASGTVGYLKLPEIEQTRFAREFGMVPHDLLRPDNYKTWGVTGSLTAAPSPTLRVTLQSSLFNGAQQRSSLEGSISSLASDYINARDSVFPVSGSRPAFSLAKLPLIANDVQRVTDKSLTSTNTISLNWQPWVWLPITATAGINTKQRTDESYVPFGFGTFTQGSGGGQNCARGTSFCDTVGFYGLGRGTSHDQTLSLGTTFPAFRQRVMFAVGGNVYQTSTADFAASTNELGPGVSVPSSFNCSLAASCGANQATSDASTYGWYLEPRLNVASRFFVAPGFRLDGGSGGTKSSASGGGLSGLGGLSAFPKLNFSYLAVDRQDQPPLWGVISQLRPRIAFGLAGIQPAPQDKLRILNRSYSPIVALNDSTQVPAVFISALGNTQLHPERSTELEGGFDATLWRDRLSVTYTEYHKMRNDAILGIPTAPSLGYIDDKNYVIRGEFGGYSKNIGDVRNTGREITLNVIPIQLRAFAWTVNANLTQDKNVIVRLNPGQKPICLGSFGCAQRVTPGYPIASTWARPIVSYADANQDGIIEVEEIRLADSAVYIGQETPNYQLNMATDVSVLNGRLSVHGTFAYTNGLTQINQASEDGGTYTVLPNAPGTTLATQAAVTASTSRAGYRGSIIGLVQTVNTFRFQDLSINYQVPKEVSTLFRAPRMSVAVQGSNLGLHTNYRGKDPNVNAYSTASGEATLDSGQIPQPRTWWLRITLGN